MAATPAMPALPLVTASRGVSHGRMNMDVYLGCDVGTVSVKAALLTDLKLNSGYFTAPALPESEAERHNVYFAPYKRIHGSPLEAASELIGEIKRQLPADAALHVALTGSGARKAAESMGVARVGDFKALAAGVATFYPETRSVMEMGGENSRFIRVISRDGGGAGIIDYGANGDCAAGTGSFMDQQATRLGFNVEQAGQEAFTAERGAKIAGRCSVFAKSDMIHAQQKGATPAQVLRGLCDAVARSFKAGPASGVEMAAPAAFVGGVARNPSVVRALREAFGVDEETIFVPANPEYYGALGAAVLLEMGEGSPESERAMRSPGFEAWEVLDTSMVRFLADEHKPQPATAERAYLGVDIGSVSTNLVLIDEEGRMVDELYLRTRARPVEVVGEGLMMLRERNGRIAILGVGATGSGRELVGELIGADAIHDEITAHKTGAFRIARQYLDEEVDTIFEIGGQDAKYIRLDRGVVVDFAMNEACAAGTGSFLEEQAEKLGISIVDEFSDLALGAKAPIRMGERCTVYMETDVTQRLREGAPKDDVIAGLAYSVVQNYLNRVARGRPVGDVIFFQGGTAYNRSVAAAFSKVTGKRIIVPPHNGVMGAYGVALLAMEQMKATGTKSTFRGFDISAVDYSVSEFTCRSCDNQCDVQAFEVEGKKTFWGDKCSEKYRREAKTELKPVGDDLMAARADALERDYLDLLAGEGDAGAREALQARGGQRPKVGMLRSMYFFDRFPFWNTYLKALGMDIVLSPATTKRIADSGVEEAVAEPCFPIQASHGHLAALEGVELDHVVIPSQINAESADKAIPSHACPWGQTLPFLLRRTRVGETMGEKVLVPVVHFREGREFVERELWGQLSALAGSRKAHKEAVRLGYRAMERFSAEIKEKGRKVLEKVRAEGRQAIVLLGRPYNVNDPGLNMNVPSKLRKTYGIDVIPMDCLPIADTGVGDIHPNMYWNYGRKILAAAKWTSQFDWLHPVYFTNFKCGPDSYVKGFAADAAGKPYLTLQFDAHGNDAGMLTRCEAYLDSKGFLRWWN